MSPLSCLLILASFLSFLCILAPTGPILADSSSTHVWRPLNGPPGTITHLTLDARQPDRLWAVVAARTMRGDDRAQWLFKGRLRQAQAIYRSADGGATWRPAGNGLPYGEITALAYDPLSAQLYVGLVGGGEELTRPQGLFRSGDGGATWQRVNLAPAHRRLVVKAIGRSADGTTLYVGAVESSKYPRSFVYRSEDNGATWQEFQALEFEQASGSILTDLILDPQDPWRLYITTYGGLFISGDGGQSWKEAALPPCPRGQRLLVAEARGRLLPSRLYLSCVKGSGDATSTHFLRSDDGGKRWQELNHEPLAGKARAMAVLPGDPSILILATDRNLYRSSDGGEHWKPLSGAREVVGATALLAHPERRGMVFAATGHGCYVSYDAGEHWASLSYGLPPNGKLQALLTSPRQPHVVYAALQWGGPSAGEPLVSLLRSDDGGRSWHTLVTGPWGGVQALAVHPQKPDHLFAATSHGLLRSDDGGATWTEVSLDGHPVQALAFHPADADIIYAGVYGGVYRSADGGDTWEERGLQLLSVYDVAVTPAGQLYAATRSFIEGRGGLYRSTDEGQTWQRLTSEGRGLETTFVRRLWLDRSDPQRLYIAPSARGLYRSIDGGESWQAAGAGLPADSDIISLLQTSDGALWASGDGGGVYRSTDGGRLWKNLAAGLGENLVLALAAGYGEQAGLFAATDTAGLWVLGQQRRMASALLSPTALDARIEIVWPHGGAPVQEAELANIGLRLFYPGSLVPPPCAWTPRVEIWQAMNTEPARPLQFAQQRLVEGHPFPFWELNDVDVSAARDPQTKLYFLVRVPGVRTATSIWAHGADPRTYFPHQDTPAGIATDEPQAVEARIQIVWPHDGLGREQPVDKADWANVTVALFEPGTGRSVPLDWEPAGLTLYGAWNQEVGRPLATEAEKRLVRRGAITFPVWDFNNIDVRAARNPLNKLYLWVEVTGVTTYPTIWAHGADARTLFPVEDEPIAGCGVSRPLWPPTTLKGGSSMYVGDAADILTQVLARAEPDIPAVSSGSGSIGDRAAEALRAILVSPSRGLIFQRQAKAGQEYIFVAEGVGPVAVAALGGRVYLFWMERGELWQQWWAEDSEIWEALRVPPQAARVVRGTKGLELGIAGDRLGDRAWAHFQLLRLYSAEESEGARVAGHWEPVWSWREAEPGSWGGLDGEVRIVGRGLERFQLIGALPDDFEAAPRVFAESGTYSKQRVGSIWERQGDVYVRVTTQLRPTPMTTLSRFILALREGNLDEAAKWVSDPALVEEALGYGWSLPRPEGDQLLAVGGYLETEGEPMEFFSRADPAFRFRVHFRWDALGWLITDIEALDHER